MPNVSSIKCLLSHKCGRETHDIGKRLQTILAQFDVELQIDPFSVGDDVTTRMQTFDIEALAFLSSPESLASSACQLELRAALRQALPLFALLLRGDLSNDLKKRSVWFLPAPGTLEFTKGAELLAESIKTRVAFHRKVRLLYPENYYQETSDAARSIATESERTLIAEYACELTRRCQRIKDPSTLFWVALALGRADTPQAGRLLDHLTTENHPLVIDGIRQAKEMLRDHSGPIPQG